MTCVMPGGKLQWRRRLMWTSPGKNIRRRCGFHWCLFWWQCSNVPISTPFHSNLYTLQSWIIDTPAMCLGAMFLCKIGASSGDMKWHQQLRIQFFKMMRSFNFDWQTRNTQAWIVPTVFPFSSFTAFGLNFFRYRTVYSFKWDWHSLSSCRDFSARALQ